MTSFHAVLKNYLWCTGTEFIELTVTNVQTFQNAVSNLPKTGKLSVFSEQDSWVLDKNEFSSFIGGTMHTFVVKTVAEHQYCV